MAAHTLTAISSLAAGTSNAAASFTFGSVIDLGDPTAATGKDGGVLFLKLANGTPGPTVAAEMVIFESTTIGSSAPAVPSTAAGDANWKQVWSFSGTTVAGRITSSTYDRFGPRARYLLALIRNNTGQAVVGEALGQAFNY